MERKVVSLSEYKKKKINDQIQELEELVIQVSPDLDEETRLEVSALMQYVKEQWLEE